MTAPAPTPAEQQQIARFGIFEEEERAEENPDWVYDSETGWLYGPHESRPGLRVPVYYDLPKEHGQRLADALNKRAAQEAAWTRAALAAMPARVPVCGALSPAIPGWTAEDTRQLMCELPHAHGGAHEHDNGDGLLPTRWIAALTAPAAGHQQQAAEVRAEVVAELGRYWENEPPDWAVNAILAPLAAALADAERRGREQGDALRKAVMDLADDLDTDADVQNVLGAGNWKITHLIETAARLRAVLDPQSGPESGPE